MNPGAGSSQPSNVRTGTLRRTPIEDAGPCGMLARRLFLKPNVKLDDFADADPSARALRDVGGERRTIHGSVSRCRSCCR